MVFRSVSALIIGASLTFYNKYRRDNIFDSVKMAFIGVSKENLPIYGIAKARNLSDFTTSENDVKRGMSRVPLILARLYDEDISFSKTPTKN